MAVSVFAMACIFLASPLFAVQGLEIKWNEKCVGKTFCDQPPENYPYEYLEQYAKDNSRNMILGMPQNDPTELQTNHYDDDINCKKTATVIKPFSYYMNDTTRLVVVQTSFFTQYVEEVECRTTGSPCFEPFQFNDRVNASCQPTKGDIQLYLFDPSTQDVIHKRVTVNMCCSCRIRRL